jgi:hypothetical protein
MKATAGEVRAAAEMSSTAAHMAAAAVTATAATRHRGRGRGEGNRERGNAYRFEFCHGPSLLLFCRGENGLPSRTFRMFPRCNVAITGL